MKRMLFVAGLLSSTMAMADGHYAGIRWESRDGREGAPDATAVGFTFGKQFTPTTAAEFYTRYKWDHGQDANNTRVEGAVINTFPVTNDWSVYARTAFGERFDQGDQWTYWSIEPGVRYRLAPDWTVKTGIRLRDSFNTDKSESTRTYRAAVEHAVNKDTSVNLSLDQSKGDSEFRALGVGVTHRF